MPRYVAVTEFQASTNLPSDRYENVWHFGSATGGGTKEDCKQIAERISQFWNNTAPGQPQLSGFLDPNIETLALIKVYEETAAGLGNPMYTNGFNLISRLGTTPFPEQVACCMSYYSTHNAPRHRGRLYLGPFNTGAQATTARGGPAAEMVTSICGEATGMILQPAPFADAPNTLQTPDAIVPSPVLVPWAVRSGGGTDTKRTGIVVYEAVTAGWVDNEWDIQRRRALPATSRQTFPPPAGP